MYVIKSEASFDAAHFLTNYGEKCENLHGHRWRVVAAIESKKLKSSSQEKDMVADFSVFKTHLRKIVKEFDHMFIVEKGSLQTETIKCLLHESFKLKIVPWRTTAENIAHHIFNQLAECGYDVSYVQVYETPLNCAIYKK